MLCIELFIARTVLRARYYRQRGRRIAQRAGIPGSGPEPARRLSAGRAWHPRASAACRTPRATRPPPPALGMLSHLGASEGQSQQALSNALGIHRSAVVALVDDLEQRGLAERRRDPADRRAYTLYLTPAGRDLLSDLERTVDERDVELLSALEPFRALAAHLALAACGRVAGPHGRRSSGSGAVAAGATAARGIESVRPARGGARGAPGGKVGECRASAPHQRTPMLRALTPLVETVGIEPTSAGA